MNKRQSMKKSDSKQKILVDSHFLLGDLVITLPMIKVLRVNFPNAIIDIIVASKSEEQIVSLLDIHVDNYYYFQMSKMSKGEIVKFILKLRHKKYDYGIVQASSNLNSLRKGAFFLKLIGCRNQIGEATRGIIEYNNAIDRGSITHLVERNINLLRGFHINCEFHKPIFHISIEMKEDALGRIGSRKKGLVTLCLGTGNFIWKEIWHNSITYNCKNWGLNKFIQLSILLQNVGYQVVWLGGIKEQKEMRDFLALRNREYIPDVINLLGETSILEAIGILSISDLVIGGDTGLMHCAAACDVKTISIIGATDPNEILPYSCNAKMVYLYYPCSPCYGTERAVSCKNRKCLNDISIKMVFDVAMDILKNGVK